MVEFARRHEIPVAVRGGGHSAAGLAVADGAIQLDLVNHRQVRVDSERRVASVGGGSRIRDLLDRTLAAGLYTPMGGCGDVGVAGLTLAGGDTFGMGLHGTACDNLIGAQVVTADGDLQEAAPGRNDDLYWALRGGGGNFGVVTRLDFRLYPVEPWVVATWSIPADRAHAALPLFRDLVRAAPDMLGAAFVFSPPAGAMAYCAIAGTVAEAERRLADWRTAFHPTVPTVQTITPNATGVVLPPSAFAADAVYLSDLPDAVIDLLRELAAQAPAGATIYLPVSRGAVTRVDTGDTAFPLRQPGVHVAASAPWTDGTNRARAEEWIDRFGAAIRQYGRLAYVNYLGAASSERVADAYGGNYARLARLKARYDSTNLFRCNHNIMPAR